MKYFSICFNQDSPSSCLCTQWDKYNARSQAEINGRLNFHAKYDMVFFLKGNMPTHPAPVLSACRLIVCLYISSSDRRQIETNVILFSCLLTYAVCQYVSSTWITTLAQRGSRDLDAIKRKENETKERERESRSV